MKKSSKSMALIVINFIFLGVFIYSLGNTHIFSDARTGIAVLGVYITLNVLSILLSNLFKREE